MNMQRLIGSHDLVMITLDTLRFDVAQEALRDGQTPGLADLLPPAGWERRHSPGSFTYAAHHAFFAGFLPTPARPGSHGRLFAARFAGSETTDEQTCVFDQADIVNGLAARGYRTVCIGGVGFFNKQTALSRVLPGLFQESFWTPEMGVTGADSTRHQVRCAQHVLSRLPKSQRIFLFLNVSALHQPNWMFAGGEPRDSPRTQAAALAYVDAQLQPLWRALADRGPTVCLVFSDHGTAYGEEGYVGHRVALPCVWEVPYAQFVLGTFPATRARPHTRT